MHVAAFAKQDGRGENGGAKKSGSFRSGSLAARPISNQAANRFQNCRRDAYLPTVRS